MKRTRALIAAAAVLAVLTAAALIAGRGEPLPVPGYPLAAETVEAALQEWGVDWTLEELEETGERNPDHSSFILYDAEGKRLLGTVSSGMQDGERMVHLFFRSAGLPREECEKALLCASRLFGGFSGDRVVSDRFAREFDSLNTTRYDLYTADRNGRDALLNRARWSRRIDGVYCQVILGQTAQEDPQEYVWSVTFASDWDAFFLLDRF